MQTVVITGGSRGIGRAAVELFAARGDRVYFLYEKNTQAAREVEARTGARGIQCDVADTAAVRQAIGNLPDVDVLICNAGICHYGLMQSMSEGIHVVLHAEGHRHTGCLAALQEIAVVRLAGHGNHAQAGVFKDAAVNGPGMLFVHGAGVEDGDMIPVFIL